MYTFAASVVLPKGANAQWTVKDVSQYTLAELTQNFQDVRVQLTNPVLTGPLLWSLSSLPTGLMTSSMTFTQWLTSLGNNTIPTTPGEAKLTTKYVQYNDAYRAGYKVQPGLSTTTLDANIPLGDKKDLNLRRADLDMRMLPQYAMVSVNGYYHLTIANAKEAWVLDGMKSCFVHRENFIGVTSFSKVGKITYIPITADMIYQQGHVTPTYYIHRWFDANEPGVAKYAVYDQYLLMSTITDGNIRIKRCIARLDPLGTKTTQLVVYNDAAVAQISSITINGVTKSIADLGTPTAIIEGVDNLLVFTVASDFGMTAPGIENTQWLYAVAYNTATPTPVPLPDTGMRYQSYFNLKQSVVGKTVLMVLAGTLLLPDAHSFTVIGDQAVCVDIAQSRLIDRFLESQSVLDWSFLPHQRSTNNSNQFVYQDFLSDANLKALFTSNYCFFVVVDTPSINWNFVKLHHHPNIAGTYTAYINPVYPVVTDLGRTVNYWSREDHGQWGITAMNCYTHDRTWSTAKITQLKNMDDHSYAQDPFRPSDLYMQKISTTVVG